MLHFPSEVQHVGFSSKFLATRGCPAHLPCALNCRFGSCSCVGRSWRWFENLLNVLQQFPLTNWGCVHTYPLIWVKLDPQELEQTLDAVQYYPVKLDYFRNLKIPQDIFGFRLPVEDYWKQSIFEFHGTKSGTIERTSQQKKQRLRYICIHLRLYLSKKYTLKCLKRQFREISIWFLRAYSYVTHRHPFENRWPSMLWQLKSPLRWPSPWCSLSMPGFTCTATVFILRCPRKLGSKVSMWGKKTNIRHLQVGEPTQLVVGSSSRIKLFVIRKLPNDFGGILLLPMVPLSGNAKLHTQLLSSTEKNTSLATYQL